VEQRAIEARADQHPDLPDRELEARVTRRRRREAHHRSGLPAKPRPAEKSSAVFPLTRHSATRCDHVSEFVMHARVALSAPLARTVLVHRDTPIDWPNRVTNSNA
jgi:hypothetical protein